MIKAIVAAALSSISVAVVAANPAFAVGAGPSGMHGAPGITLVRQMGSAMGAAHLGSSSHIGSSHIGSSHIRTMNSGPSTHHHHRHFRDFGFIDTPYYDDDGGYDCGWLHRKAVVTGSRYWWQRYYDCTGTY